MCGFAGKFSLNSLERTTYLDKQFDKAYKKAKSIKEKIKVKAIQNE